MTKIFQHIQYKKHIDFFLLIDILKKNFLLYIILIFLFTSAFYVFLKLINKEQITLTEQKIHHYVLEHEITKMKEIDVVKFNFVFSKIRTVNDAVNFQLNSIKNIISNYAAVFDETELNYAYLNPENFLNESYRILDSNEFKNNNLSKEIIQDSSWTMSPYNELGSGRYLITMQIDKYEPKNIKIYKDEFIKLIESHNKRIREDVQIRIREFLFQLSWNLRNQSQIASSIKKKITKQTDITSIQNSIDIIDYYQLTYLGNIQNLISEYGLLDDNFMPVLSRADNIKAKVEIVNIHTDNNRLSLFNKLTNLQFTIFIFIFNIFITTLLLVFINNIYHRKYDNSESENNA